MQHLERVGNCLHWHNVCTWPDPGASLACNDDNDDDGDDEHDDKFVVLLSMIKRCMLVGFEDLTRSIQSLQSAFKHFCPAVKTPQQPGNPAAAFKHLSKLSKT